MPDIAFEEGSMVLSEQILLLSHQNPERGKDKHHGFLAPLVDSFPAPLAEGLVGAEPSAKTLLVRPNRAMRGPVSRGEDSSGQQAGKQPQRQPRRHPQDRQPAAQADASVASPQLMAQATTLTPLGPELPAYRVALPGWWLIIGHPIQGDRLVGNSGSELMFGFGGNDVLEGKGGDDRLYGGEGNDLLAGGGGEDYLQGEAGPDDLFGGAGRDRLDGGPGDDRIRGGAGDDWILLSSGSDEIEGGPGWDAFDARVSTAGTGLAPVGSGAETATNTAFTGAVTLSYQVDFIETRLGSKQRVTLAPRASLALFFHEALTGETSAKTFATGTNLPSLAQQLAQPLSGNLQQPPQPGPSGLPPSALNTGTESTRTVAAQRLRSVELVMAPWGEANRIDFSLKKIKSVFATYGDIQAPAIELNLAQQILRYGTPAVSGGKRRGKRRSKTPDTSQPAILHETSPSLSGGAPELARGVFPDTAIPASPLDQALDGQALDGQASEVRASGGQALGLTDTLPVDMFPTELWAASGATSQDAFTTVIVQGFQHATGSFGDDRLTGDEQANIFFGGHGQDRLMGGAGHDLLVSNEGDWLTGGSGEDCFKLNAAWRKKIRRGRTTPDEITPVQVQDFNSTEGDRIHLENDVFGTVALSSEKSLQYQPFASLQEGPLLPEQLLLLEAGAVFEPSLISEEIHLVYNGGSGELFYRGAEVLGGLASRLPVAILAGAPQLQASDFIVV